MIHTQAAVIKPGTLTLLRRLQRDPRLADHFLVGGTALALLYGHRYSVDLDLFTQNKFDENALEVYLQEEHEFNTTAKFAHTLMGFIDGVKVDFITHTAPLVEPLLHPEELRLATPIDIAAMKLNTISQSGKRQKDFYDLYFLLEHYSLANMLAAYEEKYPRSSPLIPVRAVVYFDEIDFAHEPPVLIQSVSFKKVQQRLRQAVQRSDKTF
jgi:hypothetical protein